jgi:hypothetical protein
MTMGSISPGTKKLILEAMAREGITEDQITLEVCLEEDDDPDEVRICGLVLNHDGMHQFNTADAWPVYEITVIYAGVHDESFYVGGNYEVNIADWIAADCAREAREEDSNLGWSVWVNEYVHEDAGTIRYTVDSETYRG